MSVELNRRDGKCPDCKKRMRVLNRSYCEKCLKVRNREYVRAWRERNQGEVTKYNLRRRVSELQKKLSRVKHRTCNCAERLGEVLNAS